MTCKVKRRINPQLLLPFLGPSVLEECIEPSVLAISKGIILWGKEMVRIKIFTNSIAPFIVNFVG